MQDLLFNLDVEDGWPPVAKEGLLFEREEGGQFRLKVPPFFVKNLSVDDVLDIQCDPRGEVQSWAHILMSGRSTIWIMDFGEEKLSSVIDGLKRIGCNVERFREFDYYSIDVPNNCSIEVVTDLLDELPEETAPVAYPSWRHE